MTILTATQVVKMAKYTGSNSAEIISLFSAMQTLGYGVWSVESEAGGVLTIRTFLNGGYSTIGSVSSGNWVVLGPGAAWWLDVTDEIMGINFASYASMSASTQMAPAFRTLMATTAGAMGVTPSITVPGLNNANFDVPIYPPQPTTDGAATPFLTGNSSLLGSLSITGLTGGQVGSGAKLIDTSGNVNTNPNYGKWTKVRVNVANSGAVQLAGAAIIVHIAPA